MISCSSCGGERFHVIDSRRHETHIRRRRVCLQCQQRFSTYEVTVPDAPRGGATGAPALIYAEDMAKIRAAMETLTEAIAIIERKAKVTDLTAPRRET